MEGGESWAAVGAGRPGRKLLPLSAVSAGTVGGSDWVVVLQSQKGMDSGHTFFERRGEF